MPRAFVAIVPPRDVLDAVGKVAWRVTHRPAELSLPRLLGPRWATRDKWHITLQFLGANVDLDAAADALRTVRGAPAHVRLGGMGGFPNARRANVLWIGVLEGRESLAGLAGAVGDAMAPVVGSAEERTFHPHLTLARLTRPADLRAAEAVTARERVGPRWTAERLVLFESTTGSDAPRYRPHAEVVLDHP